MVDETPEVIGGGGNGTGGGNQQTTTDQAGAFDWQAQIGDTFKDQPDALKGFTEKGYTNDKPGFQKLAKDFTEAQKVIGQKGLTKLPENATDAQKAEWKKSYREVMGVPADKTGYTDLPAEVDGIKADENVRGAFLDLAQELDLTPAQVKRLDAWSFEMTKAATADAEKINAEFDTAANKLYGQNTEAKIREGQVLMAENVDESLKPLLDKLDNNALIVVSNALINQRSKLGSEDLPATGGAGGAGNRSADDLHQEKLQLMGSAAYKNAFDPQHEATKKKVLELNEAVVKLRAAGK